jgi:phosphohistidine phosphatase
MQRQEPEMLLYLIRHAEAEDIGTAGVTRDFDRPLTTRGRLQARALAQAFVAREIIVDAVAASPLVRAHQTAAELITVWLPDTRVETIDELAIGSLKPAKLSDNLAAVRTRGARIPSRDQKAVAAVGHMPDLATYLEWLIAAAPGTVHFAKAAAACIRFKGEPARAAGTLEWLVTPRWFL